MFQGMTPWGPILFVAVVVVGGAMVVSAFRPDAPATSWTYALLVVGLALAAFGTIATAMFVPAAILLMTAVVVFIVTAWASATTQATLMGTRPEHCGSRNVDVIVNKRSVLALFLAVSVLACSAPSQPPSVTHDRFGIGLLPSDPPLAASRPVLPAMPTDCHSSPELSPRGGRRRHRPFLSPLSSNAPDRTRAAYAAMSVGSKRYPLTRPS